MNTERNPHPPIFRETTHAKGRMDADPLPPKSISAAMPPLHSEDTPSPWRALQTSLQHCLSLHALLGSFSSSPSANGTIRPLSSIVTADKSGAATGACSPDLLAALTRVEECWREHYHAFFEDEPHTERLSYAWLPSCVSDALDFLHTVSCFLSTVVPSFLPLASDSLDPTDEERGEGISLPPRSANAPRGQKDPFFSSSSSCLHAWPVCGMEVQLEMAAFTHWLTLHVVDWAVEDLARAMQRHPSLPPHLDTAVSHPPQDAEAPTSPSLLSPLSPAGEGVAAPPVSSSLQVIPRTPPTHTQGEREAGEEEEEEDWCHSGPAWDAMAPVVVETSTVRLTVVLVDTIDTILSTHGGRGARPPPSGPRPSMQEACGGWRFVSSRRVQHLCYVAALAALGVAEYLPSATVAKAACIVAQCARSYGMEQEWSLSQTSSPMHDEESGRETKNHPHPRKEEEEEEEQTTTRTASWGDAKGPAIPRLASSASPPLFLSSSLLRPFYPSLRRPSSSGVSSYISPVLVNEEREWKAFRGGHAAASASSLVTPTTTLSHLHVFSHLLQCRMDATMPPSTSTTHQGRSPCTAEEESLPPVVAWTEADPMAERRRPPDDRRRPHPQHDALEEARRALLPLAALKRLQAREEGKRQRRWTTTSFAPIATEHCPVEGVEKWGPTPHPSSVDSSRAACRKPTQTGECASSSPRSTASSFSSGAIRKRKTMRDYAMEMPTTACLPPRHPTPSRPSDHAVVGMEEAEGRGVSGRAAVERREWGGGTTGMEEDSPRVCRRSSPCGTPTTHAAFVPNGNATNAVDKENDSSDADELAEVEVDATVTVEDLATVAEALASFQYRDASFWGTVARYVEWQLSTASHSPTLAAPSVVSPSDFETERKEKLSFSTAERKGTPELRFQRCEEENAWKREAFIRDVLRICFALAFTQQKNGYAQVMNDLVRYGFLHEGLPNPIKE